MLRPRFTLRQMVILVAVAAVVIWFVLIPLPAIYRNRAEYHERQMEMAIQGNMFKELEARGLRTKLHVYHKALKVKYERASSRPWISIGFDPPEPE